MISLPNSPKIIEEKDNYAVFEISPLYPGYGATLGNALRRVLLSSIEGTAITSVKIEGAAHEFSTIPHVHEDVINIILNLKRIRFKLEGDGPIKAELNASGEKTITAKDIKTPTGLIVTNTDQHIATLTDKKAKLSMEIELQRGVGYVPAEQIQKEKLPVGMIAVDAIFSPIIFANYESHNIRFEQRTDYNSLVLKIQTDGSITPQEALNKASQILIDHLRTVGFDEKMEE